VTFFLVLLLLHPDGSVTTSEPVRLPTEAECQREGRAWAAQAVRRDDRDVVIVRCEVRGRR
jgi:hypothetical protein